MRYSDDIIEEVRMKNDIVDVISQYVRLTRSIREMTQSVKLPILQM